MRTKNITVAEVELTAFALAKELMSWNEPIPDFGTRFPNILESCLGMPFIRQSKPTSREKTIFHIQETIRKNLISLHKFHK